MMSRELDTAKYLANVSCMRSCSITRLELSRWIVDCWVTQEHIIFTISLQIN